MPCALRVLVDRFALIGAAIMLVIVILLGISGSVSAFTLLSSLLLLVAGYALFRASLLLRTPVLQLLGWLGALAAAGFIVITQAWVWGMVGQSNANGFADTFVPACALACVAAFTADAGLLFGMRLQSVPARVVRGIALAATAILMGAIAMLCLVGNASSLAGMQTPLWPLVALTCLATHVAMPVMARSEARRERALLAASHDRAMATLQCVRCGQWMQMHSGKAACPRCRSIITLEFQEPRCACGYPLHRLTAANCPECGTGIPADKRWLGGAPPPLPPADAIRPSST